MRCVRGITKPSIWLAAKNISITTLNNWSSWDGNKNGLGHFQRIIPPPLTQKSTSPEICVLLSAVNAANGVYVGGLESIFSPSGCSRWF